MTEKLQLMLLTCWLGRFLDINVSQGSVATCLKCAEIFNDQFVTHLLLSPVVKEFWKSVNNCRSYGPEPNVLFFYSCGIFITLHIILHSER